MISHPTEKINLNINCITTVLGILPILKINGNPMKIDHKIIPGIKGITIIEPSNKAEEPAVILMSLKLLFFLSRKWFNARPPIQNNKIKDCQYQKFKDVLLKRLMPDNISEENIIPLY